MDRSERDADSRKVERLKREIAGVEARLKETYDRARTALDERIRASSPRNTPRIRGGWPGRSSAWKSRCDSWPGNTRGSRRSWPGRSGL